MKYRPSSLPMLAACPRFAPDESRGEDDKNEGTERHNVFAEMLSGNDSALGTLDDDQRERVEWAVEYVKCHAPMSDHPLHIERRLSLLDDDFNEITAGTPDVTCGPELFDLKWRERDYLPQMAAYAAAMMREHGWPEVRVHLLFAERKHAQVFTLTEAQAMLIVNTVIAAASQGAAPVACDYCGWCANRLTCSALTTPVSQVANFREDIKSNGYMLFMEWLQKGAHASELNNGKLAGEVLRIARTIANWCEAVEHHCRELAIKQGVVSVGYKLQSRKGNRYIPSVTEAFARVGLPQTEFLAACDVKFSALVDATAKLNAMPNKQAEHAVEEKLGDALQRKDSTMSLVVDKEATK